MVTYLCFSILRGRLKSWSSTAEEHEVACFGGDAMLLGNSGHGTYAIKSKGVLQFFTQALSSSLSLLFFSHSLFSSCYSTACDLCDRAVASFAPLCGYFWANIKLFLVQLWINLWPHSIIVLLWKISDLYTKLLQYVFGISNFSLLFFFKSFISVEIILKLHVKIN